MRKFGFRSRHARRGRTAIIAAVASCVAIVGAATAAVGGFNPFGNGQVGSTYANGLLLPTNQWISPLGTRILDDGTQPGTGGIGVRADRAGHQPDADAAGAGLRAVVEDASAQR